MASTQNVSVFESKEDPEEMEAEVLAASRMDTFADVLKTFRLQAHLSQEALAERSGVSTRTVSDMECGAARSPRTMTLVLLEEALGLSKEDRERLRSAASAHGSPPSVRRVMPAAMLVPLVGREADVARTLELVLAQDTRLLTITGPAGIGKTALSLHLAREAGPHFDATLIVELAAIPAAEFVASKVALAAGVKRVRGDSVAESIAEHWGSRSVLLLLDNFEHVLGAAPFITELLAFAPAVTIVSTSRVPLGVPRERRYALAPIGLAASVALLVDRVSTIVPGFAMTQANTGALERVGRSLGGFPLAIELAAPLFTTLSAAALAENFEGMLPLLASSENVVSRHASMRDAIAWSYELLAPEPQRIFRWLSVFNGPFSVRAAHAVAGEEGAPASLQTMQAVAKMVDHNLLGVRSDFADPHFEFYMLMREYGRGLLRERGESDAAQERLATYCLEAASAVKFSDPATQTTENLDRLGAEAANIDSALAWACESGRTELGMRLCLETYGYWWLRMPDTGLTWTRRLLENAEHLKEPIDADLLATAYLRATGLADQCESVDIADRLAERALQLHRALGRDSVVAALLGGAGTRARTRGDYTRAFELLEESLRIRRALGVNFAIAISLYELGATAAEAGDPAVATPYLDESLSRLQEAKSDLGVAMAFAQLSAIALREKSVDRARSFANESLRIAQAIGHSSTLGYAKTILARAELEDAHYERAQQSAREAIAIAQLSKAPWLMPEALEALAAIASAQGHARSAARALGAAANLRKRENAPIATADREEKERLAERLKAALGAPAYNAEFTIGAYGPSESLFQDEESAGSDPSTAAGA
jgi:predicted ATPase/DNA-binding transcriptional regulator YiaG